MTQLKDSIIKGQEYPGMISISIKKEINIAAVYSDLKRTTSNSSISPTTGEGGVQETFYNGDKKIGILNLLVPNVRIIAWKKEYRGIFKEMFVNLGLPPEKVDEFKFEYNPSVW